MYSQRVRAFRKFPELSNLKLEVFILLHLFHILKYHMVWIETDLSLHFSRISVDTAESMYPLSLLISLHLIIFHAQSNYSNY